MIGDAGPWGTGPFVLKEGVSLLDKRSPTVTLVPNTNYWNKARTPKVTIKFDNIISKAEALEEVAKGGKVDIVTELTPAEAVALKGNKNARVVESKAKTVLVGVFNENKAGSVWTDIAVRKAINNAVDKAMVIKEGSLGYGSQMPSMITKGSYAYDASLQAYAYTPAKAKPVLAKHGVKSLVIASDEGHKAIADAVAKSLAASGVTATVDTSGKGDAWDIKLVEHFDWSPNYPYGVVFREFFGKDGGFRNMPEDAGFEAIAQKIINNPTKQEGFTKQMDRYVHDQANVLFLYAPSKLYAVSNKVNFTPYRSTVLELAETSIK